MKSRNRFFPGVVAAAGLLLTLPSMAETLNEIRFYDNSGGGATGNAVPNGPATVITSPGVIPAGLPGAGNAGFVTGNTGLTGTHGTSNVGVPAGLTREATAGTGGSDRYTMTAQGSDFWGSVDRGAYAFDNASPGQSGDFSAIVRSVSIGANPADYVAANWGRTGLGARTDVNSATSLTVNTLRQSGLNGDIVQTGRFAGQGDTDENRQLIPGSNAINGDVRTTAVWLGLHRYNGVVYSTIAPDVGGVPGTWSVSVGNAFGGAAQSTGTLQIGLVHQSHEEGAPAANTAVFDGFRVDNAGNNANFANDLLSRGQFPIIGNRGVQVVNGNKFGGSANGSELGIGVPGAVSWRVDVLGPKTPGLHIDIYTDNNINNQGAWNSYLAGNPIPYYSGKVTTTANAPAGAGVYWNNGGGYNAEWQAGGQFGAGAQNQENYSARMTGEIYLPSVGTYNFRDGADDYSYLAINGQVLVDDNNWVGVNGFQPEAGGEESSPVGSFAAAASGWYNIDFRMAEGGGGDNQALYWDFLPDDVTDPTAGGTIAGNPDWNINSPAGLGVGALVPQSFLRGVSIASSLDHFSAVDNGVFVDENGNSITLAPGTYDVWLSTNGSRTLHTITVVPEPASTGLLAIGAAGLLLRRRRK